MHTSRLTKALLLCACTLLWLVAVHAGPGRTLLAALGATLVMWAWITLSERRHRTYTAPLPVTRQPQVRVHVHVHKHCADRRIERKPRRRLERDPRCPATRAPARARRRPTRR